MWANFLELKKILIKLRVMEVLGHVHLLEYKIEFQDLKKNQIFIKSSFSTCIKHELSLSSAEHNLTIARNTELITRYF